MNKPKHIELGFIIIVPENNPKLAEITASSLKFKYSGSPFIFVVTESISDMCYDDISKIGIVFRGGNTYSSLISLGMMHAPSEWNMIIISGTQMRSNAHQKYSCFIDSPKDILFPIVDRKANFIEGTLNGIMFNKFAYEELGNMPNEISDMQECKAIWGYKACNLGYKFKALVGAGLS